MNGAGSAAPGLVLKKSDFISLHLPHTKNSHYLINKEKLSLMKSNAYLINCARGGVVDENALYEVLSEGKIAGAKAYESLYGENRRSREIAEQAKKELSIIRSSPFEERILFGRQKLKQ